MDRNQRLLLATAATAPGVTSQRVRELVARGWGALDRNVVELTGDRRDAAEALAAELADRDVDVTMIHDDQYPRRLYDLRRPPSFVFWWGNLNLVDERSIGMCGSRDASDRGLQYARHFGRAVVDRGLQVVSGYARGVDVETHLGALEAGGATIIVLAEGIKHFKRKRAFVDLPFDADHVLALSEFSPGQPWSAGAAMMRNGTIAALARAMLVIEAREKGGTLNAGLQAIEIGRPVFAIDYSEDLPEGNRVLFGHGALPLRSKNELLVALDELASVGEPEQLVLGAHNVGRRSRERERSEAPPGTAATLRTYVPSIAEDTMSKEQRHVVRDGDDWLVRKPGADRASSRHDTQREADQRAAEILQNLGGGERVTHGRDGKIRSKDTIPPAKDPFPPRDKEH